MLSSSTPRGLTNKPSSTTMAVDTNMGQFITTPESLPAPRDLEAKIEFIDRYMAHPRVARNPKLHTPYARRHAGELVWAAAKLRSLVSVRTSGGEWLMFG